MRYRLQTLLIVLAVGAMALALPVAWQNVSTSNCGGNNAALTSVRMYVDFLRFSADENLNGEFAVTSANPEQREYLARIANDNWLANAQFLVSTAPYRSNPSEVRTIVIVCDRPFSNVPRYVFGNAPPTHAAGLSDGSTALLTAREFAALDRSQFVSLLEIATKQDD